MKAKDIMTTQIVSVNRNDSIKMVAENDRREMLEQLL